MFDWPATSQTSPTRTYLISSVLVPTIVNDRGLLEACNAESSTRHLPSGPAIVFFVWLANRTVMLSPGSAVPQIGTFAPRCKTMPSLSTSGTVTRAGASEVMKATVETT